MEPDANKTAQEGYSPLYHSIICPHGNTTNFIREQGKGSLFLVSANSCNFDIIAYHILEKKR